DEQYLTGTLLTSAKKQKLEYAQAGVKKLNQTLIKTYAMDYEGKRVYPKTFKIYSDLPWNVSLHVEDLNSETLEKMEKGLTAKETILQANAIYLTDTLADDPDNRYELPEGTSVKIQMEVPETTKSVISSVKVNRYEGTAADNL
ncbi:hypothetical protein, partial [Eubacterium aggregans]|uniref:hypothetical protein n=1 Tax=Eubacterium aggregans TaxID=81409 RepID=UPI003F3C9497